MEDELMPWRIQYVERQLSAIRAALAQIQVPADVKQVAGVLLRLKTELDSLERDANPRTQLQNQKTLTAYRRQKAFQERVAAAKANPPRRPGAPKKS